MILREALRDAVRQLKAAGIDTSGRDARALIAKAVGIRPDRVTLEGDMVLDDPRAFAALIKRRANGEPVSKILGVRQFWGHEFVVTPDTLDPRPETETLIAAAIELAVNAGPVQKLADLGTGSGIIAISLLKEWPDAQATATDISAAAISVAKINAEKLGAADRLAFRQVSQSEQWLPQDLGTFDMILSNPPYISGAEMASLSREVFDHDPHIALTPGGDGLDPYRAIAQRASGHLKNGGHLGVEIGWTQGGDVKAIFERAGLDNVRVLGDLDGRDRVVLGSKP